jgi:hypothetical protein
VASVLDSVTKVLRPAIVKERNGGTQGAK